MTRKHSSYSIYVCLLSFIFTLLYSYSTNAQFINVQIELEPEIETEVLSKLNFGDLVINSGAKQINLGDPSMGVFSITAINSQTIRFNLESTNTLKHFNPAINASIGIDLKAAYNNTGTNDPRNSTPFNEGDVYLQVNQNARKDRFEWETVYVYIYGNIDIGDVPLGLYEGQLRLTIDYE